MLKVKITNRIKYPNLNLNDQLDHIANKIIIRGLKDGIRSGVDIEGKRFPSVKKKIGKTLIDTGLLLDSFKSFRKSAGILIIRINAGRRKIAEYLQIDGVGKKNKKFNFFGVTDWMEKNSILHMRKEINKRLINAK